MQPVSFCTSFSLVGEFILKMSLSFSGLTSMPRYDTMKPRSFPDGTPKTHFSGFNFHLKRFKLVNVSDRSDTRSSLTRDLMTMSSTYIPTFRSSFSPGQDWPTSLGGKPP